MPRTSAGLLIYRRGTDGLEVLLVHPGGPFWTKKDVGAWSIPKGETENSDDLFQTALRELREETGFEVGGQPTPLRPVKQAGGKVVHAWAVEGDLDAAAIVSNTFTLEWPPRSGRIQEFPEIDRAGWFDLRAARRHINPGQLPLLDELDALLSSGGLQSSNLPTQD